MSDFNFPFVPARSLVMLLCALSVLLCQSAAAQRLAASTCSACVAMNSVSIYSDTTLPESRNVYSTGFGSPAVVWCAAEPTGDSGSCSNTAFIVANLQMQCSGWPNASYSWANPSQASPCPATAPYAFFQSCDCTRTCKYQGLAFDGFGSSSGAGVSGVSASRSFVPKANAVNLLRSCDLCIAGGGEWWSASDLMSSECSNVTNTVELCSFDGESTNCVLRSWMQTVVPSCHAPGQRFITATGGDRDSAIPDANPFQPAFRYTTSYQCSHGSSFCSSIRLQGANCVAMIVLIFNVPFSALYMRLSFIAAPARNDIQSPSTSRKLSNCYIVFYISRLVFALIRRLFANCCSATTPVAHRRNLVAEFLATYIFWPVAFALALIPLGIAIAVAAVGIVYLLVYVLVFLPLKACWACCGGENSNAALSPGNNTEASSVAMVSVATSGLPRSESSLEPESDTASIPPASDTNISGTRITMTDDEMSPLISRHVEASVRELRSQMQEMDARSRRMEAQLGELLARGYTYSLPH